jgi:glucosylceramidase
MPYPGAESRAGTHWEESTMLKTLWALMAVELLAVGTLGCGGNGGGGGKDLAGDVCQKADTCNALSGISAAKCKDLVNTSLQTKTGSTRSDAENALNACLAADCANVKACIDGVLSGGSAGSGGSAAGGSGGSAVGGSGGSVVGGSGGSAAGGSGGSAAGGSGGSAAGGNAGGGSGSGGTAGGAGAASGGSLMGGATGSGGTTGTSSVGGSGMGGATGGTTSAGGSPTGGTQGTGGSAAGGTGGSTSTGPVLITSAQNAYWQTGTVTTVTSGTADVNVDKNTTYQRWDGFGGCFNEMGWDALSVVSAADITNAMKLLFDPNDGANFVYGRLPLGASDYAMSWYTLDDTAGDYTMDKFSIARDQQKLIPFIKAALQVKPDIHLWASPWVVPSWMMDSNSNMKSDAQTQGAHALYMARFVEEYAKVGVKIEAIHPQNEPGYARVHWTQAELITFMKTYLGPTFAQRKLTAEIWCGTMSKDPDDTNIAKATALDADAMKYVKGFGVQWNLQAAVTTLQKANVPVMQTEHRCGNYNFDSPYWDKSRYSSTQAQNDHLYGEESWQLIRDWIVSGVNSYSAWNMVLDTFGKNLDTPPWPQNALLVVDRSAKKLIVTPAYYVFRHFSQYIAVGATRLGTSGSSDAFAFKNPDGGIVVQVYNKGTSSKKMITGVGSALSQSLYQFDVPAHGWATLRLAP